MWKRKSLAVNVFAAAKGTKEYSWNLQYCTCSLHGEAARVVRKEFPDAVIHDSYDAVLGIPPVEYRNLKLVSLDHPFL